MSKIAVVVPVYNVEKYLCRCVDSILAQTFTDFDLILVDDGTPDNCPAICEEYAQKDSRVTVIHQNNGGLSAARNAGIDWVFAYSNSEWITFIDSDDWVHPQLFQILYTMNLMNQTKISICGFQRTKEFLGFLSPIVEENSVVTPEVLWSNNRVNATVAWGKLYDRNLFKNVRYPFQKIHEDEYVTYQLLFSCPQVSYTDNPLYFYYENDEGIMGKEWSLKSLDGLWGMREQIAFFSKHNFLSAYSASLEEYIGHLAHNMIKLEKLDGQHKMKHTIKTELRKSLHSAAAQHLDLGTNRNYYYRLAYPLSNKVYKKSKKKMQNILFRINNCFHP